MIPISEESQSSLCSLHSYSLSSNFAMPANVTTLHENGTMAEVTSICANPKCGKTTKWFSQPYMTRTMIPAGNFLLSFGILVVGTSATKVLRVFQHMGLKCISLSTFFKHQRVSVAINIYLTICLLFYPNSR